MTASPRKIRIALIQQSASEDRRANVLKGLAAAEEAAVSGAQLICFAELAFDRFYPAERPKADVLTFAETVPGETTGAFCRVAAKHGAVIVLNLFEREGANAYDTSPVIDADGTLLGRTRMIHITDYPCFHETDYYTPGNLGAPVFDTAVGRIGVAICYDRHYPEYMRALGVGGAEVVVVPQAGAVDEWPEGLFEAELRVASFQNGYFTALCNRVGAEEQLTFAGESFVCDPAGRVIARGGKLTEQIVYCDLDLNAAAGSHARRLFMRDRRPELYADWVGR